MTESVRLSSLVVYNSTFGPKEGEEEKKILYYFPEDETINRKVNNVGLCEALVQFTRTMSPGNACEYLHTQNHHYLFYEAEENFWIVMALGNPVVTNQAGKKETKEHVINDAVYHAILKDIYQRFRFLHGTFLHIYELFKVDGLKAKFNIFFHELFPVLNLSDCDLLQLFNGLSFCNLEKSSVLAFQSFINSVEDRYKNVKHSLILCDRHLILTNLSKQDSQIMIGLLREKLHLDLPFSKRFKAVAKNLTTYQLNHGRFISNLFDGTENTVFVSTRANQMEQMHILVYQAFSITTCFLLDYLDTSLIELCKALDQLIGPQLVNLAKEIPTNFHSKVENLDAHMKHVFFNRETLAIDTSCHSTYSGKTSSTVPKEIMHVLSDIAGHNLSNRHQDEEIINKVHNDHWVATKKTNQKELYVVVNSKNANLININDDIRKMSFHFDNICFSD